MHHLVDHIVRIGDITKNPGAGGADVGAGGQFFTLGKPGIIAKIALVDGVPLGVPGFVGRQWKNTGDFDVKVQFNKAGFRDVKRISQATDGDIVVAGSIFENVGLG